MTAVSPGPGAMDRLRVYGEKELLGFMAEVKGKTNKELLRILPNVDGFRKDSVSSLPTRKRTMLAHFLKKGGTVANKSRADSTYYYFWRSWAEEQLSDVEGLDGLLNGLEKVASKDDDSVTLDEAVEGVFRHLHEQSFLNRCSAETLSRLLLFSPFDITDALERLVASAKPQVAVEKDRALSTLPERLQSDEELLRRLQERFGALEGEVADLSEAAKTSPTPVLVPPDLADRLAALEERLAGLANRWQENAEARQQASDVQSAAQARIEAAERSIADLESLWAGLDDSSRALSDEVRQRLAGFADELKGLSEQAPVAPSLAQSTSGSGIRLSAGRDSAPQIRVLATGADAANLLATNLEAIGLKPSGTLPFAQELLAATVTGRVVFLSGSLAPDVARALTYSLAAGHVVRARVPVGFVDASHLDVDMIGFLPSGRETAAALVLERVNNAPLEVLADALAVLASTDGIFTVATLSEGLSALPDQPLYLQLGPVFDTDVLDWSVFTKSSPLSSGGLSTLDAKALGMTHSKGKANTNELVELLRFGLSPRIPKLERTAVAYLATLEGFRTQAAPTSLQSAVYGWVWPLWRMLDLPWNDRNLQLQGGIVDGEEVDARLKLLLELTGPARDQR